MRAIVAPETAAAHRAHVQHVLAQAGLLAEADTGQALPMLPAVRAQRAKALADAGVPPLSQALLNEREAR